MHLHIVTLKFYIRVCKFVTRTHSQLYFLLQGFYLLEFIMLLFFIFLFSDGRYLQKHLARFTFHLT